MLDHALSFRPLRPLCGVLTCLALSTACSDKNTAEPPLPPLPRNIAEAMAAPESEARPNSSIRATVTQPPPTTTPPDVALAQIVGKALLPGDQVIAELLAIEVQGAQKPFYKSTVDYPFNDGAAHAISEEARMWIRNKMAAMGFSETQGKPTLSWVIHVEPDIDGQYRLETSLQSQGTIKFKKNFMVPTQYSSTRMNHVFGEDFTPKTP